MNSNEITVVENNTPASTPAETKPAQVVDKTNYLEKANEYLASMGNTLPEDKRKMFIELAQAFRLNPFKREIYAVGYGDKWNIITGYEVYLKRAEGIGLLDGWETEVTGEGEDLAVTVVINRKDWSKPFKHTVYYREVCQYTTDKNGKLIPNKVWAKQPIFMTKKVAISQAFRLCFPDDFAGMPYAEEEMPQIKQKAKYTQTEADALGVIMNATDSYGLAIFSNDEKAKYKKMLQNGQFAEAYQEAKNLLDQRAVPSDAELESEQ